MASARPWWRKQRISAKLDKVEARGDGEPYGEVGNVTWKVITSKAAENRVTSPPYEVSIKKKQLLAEVEYGDQSSER